MKTINVSFEDNEMKEKRTLRINENCAVVEFCCDKLEACIDHYEIGFMDNYENGTTKYILNQKIFDDAERLIEIIHHGVCPYCGASIKYKNAENCGIRLYGRSNVDYSRSEERRKEERKRKSV